MSGLADEGLIDVTGVVRARSTFEGWFAEPDISRGNHVSSKRLPTKTSETGVDAECFEELPSRISDPISMFAVSMYRGRELRVSQKSPRES